jgi:hypothetical protein
MKRYQFVFAFVAAIALGVYGLMYFVAGKDDSEPASAVQLPSFDGRNSTFVIDGQEVTLKNGTVRREAAPGSASDITTMYFGNEVKGDLNADGQEDVAFLIAQNTGGTGEFYYVVAALTTPEGYRTTNAFLIGDRIAPQPMQIVSNKLYVNYADRKPGEPMTASPSIGRTDVLGVTQGGTLDMLVK